MHFSIASLIMELPHEEEHTLFNIMQNEHNKLLKIAITKFFFGPNKLLNLNWFLFLESLKYNYNNLKDRFQKSKRITRNKSIQIKIRPISQCI